MPRFLDNNMYINKFGSQKLSKGGSGDILTGLISSLLAQGYKPLEATICGSLAHTLAAKKYKKNNYSLTTKDLIKEIKKLCGPYLYWEYIYYLVDY